jgi:UDP-3-O-[3-hydroxymyristoyl] N-acetylglucosamine deacetylase
VTATQYQTTPREAFEYSGVGLHTGVPCRIEVRPAAPNSGITFVAGTLEIPALAEYVVETARATVLGRDGTTISTVEHLLSALFGMGVSNARVHVDGPEIPVADGSAALYAQLIERAGIARQNELRERFVPVGPEFMRDGDRAIVVLPAASLRVRFVADFAPPIGVQYFDSEITPDVFRSEIAAARTFGYLHEVQALLDRGLAQGGTLDNALVFAPEGPMQELRWPNEPVRHKVLDLLGDFALLGAYPQCEIVALKSGHRLHCLTVKRLRQLRAGELPSASVR